MKHNLLLLLLCCLVHSGLHAQKPGTDTVSILAPIQRFYVGNGFDAGIFSNAMIQRTSGNGNVTNSAGVLRFSGFLNVGITFNFNLTRHFGAYTGVDIKNIGFIEHADGFTIKRRTYNIGVPAGVKIGNMTHKGGYLFLGAGADVPFNYKEKQYQVRSQKTKTSEWFSSRTPLLMPYVFAGVNISPGITFKAQYYPGNYLNPDFASGGIKPYAGYEVHLALFSIGFRVNYSKRADLVKKSVEETKLM